MYGEARRVCEGRARGRRHIVVKPTRQPLARMRVRVRVVWVRGLIMIWAQSVRGGGVQCLQPVSAAGGVRYEYCLQRGLKTESRLYREVGAVPVARWWSVSPN